MTREEAAGVIERLPVMSYMKKNEKQTIITTALDMAIKALQEPERKWIPVSYHEPVEEDGEDTQHGYILDCNLPDEGQEILVSSHGKVSIDECCYDDGGWYLDSCGDWMDVDAWQPLPEPYKAGEQE